MRVHCGISIVFLLCIWYKNFNLETVKENLDLANIFCLFFEL